MKKTVIFLLLFINNIPLVAVTAKKEAPKKPLWRRQRFINESAYTLVVKLAQDGGFVCKKEKKFEIAPGTKKTVFMFEKCFPSKLSISIKEGVPYIIGGVKGPKELEFAVFEGKPGLGYSSRPFRPREYIYWTIKVSGKKAPLSIQATPYLYFARREHEGKGWKVLDGIMAGLEAFGKGWIATAAFH